MFKLVRRLLASTVTGRSVRAAYASGAATIGIAEALMRVYC